MADRYKVVPFKLYSQFLEFLDNTKSESSSDYASKESFKQENKPKLQRIFNWVTYEEFIHK